MRKSTYCDVETWIFAITNEAMAKLALIANFVVTTNELIHFYSLK
jgi:hypothetical protein